MEVIFQKNKRRVKKLLGGKMNLLVTRHGETDWNKLNKVQGRVDIPLNDEGIKQANITKEELIGKDIDLIICSPLIRAKQTADIINEGLNVPIIYDERISERDFGEFEGKARTDFDFIGFWSYKNNHTYQKAENIETFFIRIYKFLEDINKKYESKSILIVGHGGVSIPINCFYNGIPADDNLLSLVIHNCELVEYKSKNRM